MTLKKHNFFWKYFLRVMLLVFVGIVLFDFIVWVPYEYNWNKFSKEAEKAQEAGYNEEYTICSREENVTLDGVEYIHFHAFRPAFLDGNYNEDLLVKSDFHYIDKVPGQNDGLVIFAKKVNSYDDQHGTSYTIINIYSICDYSMDNNEYWGVHAFVVTLIGSLIEIIMVLIFGIHKIIDWTKRIFKIKMKAKSLTKT